MQLSCQAIYVFRLDSSLVWQGISLTNPLLLIVWQIFAYHLLTLLSLIIVFFLWEYLEQGYFVLEPWSTTRLNTFWSLFPYRLGKWSDDSLLLLNSQAQITKVPVSLGVGFHSSPSPFLYLCANVLFPLTCKLHQNCSIAKVILLPWKSRCFSISVTIIYLSCVISEQSPHLFSLLLKFLILIHQAILLGYSGPFWSNRSLKISFT